MENEHICVYSDKNFLHHDSCNKYEENAETVYVLKWNTTKISCVILKDGPVTILDGRQTPSSVKLAPNIKKATKELKRILSL